jgi:hypothetical protein
LFSNAEELYVFYCRGALCILMQRSKDGALMQGFYKLEKINDGVPMLEDWVPMQEHTTVFVEEALPVKNCKTHYRSER